MKDHKSNLRDLDHFGPGAASKNLRLATDVFKRSEAEAQQGGAEPSHETILRVNFACNQNCGFCFVDRSGRMIPIDEVERSLDSMSLQARAEEFLVISGGEPAAHPRLPDIVELCRRKGFRHILLQTNAVYLARRALVEKLENMNYFISFHSHIPGIYDRLTGSKRQFPLAEQGIRNALEVGGNCVILNIIVNSLNFKQLNGYVDFVNDLRKRRKIRIFFSVLNEVGLAQAPELGVDLGKIAPFLNSALARCRERGMLVESFTGDCSIPVCQLERPAAFASKSGYSQDDVRYQDDFAGCGNRGRAKSRACRNCIYDSRCRGVPVLYAQRFGVGMLKSVTRRLGRLTR